MPRLRLTALAVADAKAPAHGRIEYWDAGLPGFGLRVTENGAKSWTALYRVHGRLRRSTLGPYPALSLADARKAARRLFGELAKGNDPAAAKAEERRREANRFETIVGEFVERHAKPNNRGWQRQNADLRREFVPHWASRPIASIGRRDILEVIDRIADRTSPRRANRYLALIKKLFAWCVEPGYLDASPAAAIKPPGREVSRERVLTADELRQIWRACEADGWPFGDLFLVLMLTAQRLGEVAMMRWRDIDLNRRIWTVPGEIAKNGVANEVPLAPPVLAIIGRSPGRREGLVFPALNGSGNPVSGFSRAKARLDTSIAEAAAPIPPWRLHDLRRTAASGMAELRVPPHVIERVLNHIGGTRAGVAGVYNRFGYLSEKRHALETWAAHVERPIVGASAQVVPLATA